MLIRRPTVKQGLVEFISLRIKGMMEAAEPFRFDFYQLGDKVVLTVYAKGIQEESAILDHDGEMLKLTFKIKDEAANRNFDLSHPVKEVSCRVYKTKMEVSMLKSEPSVSWKSLEKSNEACESRPKYPSSSKKPLNLNDLDLSLAEDKKDGEAQVEDFFKTLYKDADEDARRAMMKSFVESGGTVLSTNWDEVGGKKVEPVPPEGMEVKTFTK